MGGANILFVSHSNKRCGVYQFGKNVFATVRKSEKYRFQWVECDSLSMLHIALDDFKPDVIIYNYHPTTMPWVSKKIGPSLVWSNITGINAIQIGIIHEVTQGVADTATNYRNSLLFRKQHQLLNVLFDFYIAADPTLFLKNPFVFKTGRLIPQYINKFSIPQIPTIGSYGFGTPNKGFEKIIEKVQEEFDEAIIRINIPFAEFGDKNGTNALQIAENCRSLLKKEGLKLHITHEFLEDNELLDFLAQNSINVFLYEDNSGRGLSSAIDNALSVQRPICISGSIMFRHVLNIVPEVSTESNSLKHLIESGIDILKPLLDEWNYKNLCWDYERILDAILLHQSDSSKRKFGLKNQVISFIKRFFSLPDISFTWLRNTQSTFYDTPLHRGTLNYIQVPDSEDVYFNRILDNKARNLYAETIKQMFSVFPNTMVKKISEANVQQAFVLDTVYRNLKRFKSPKLLCVGCYEDTASMFLKQLGLTIDEIDPVINYSLHEFVNKPSTITNSYDIIFSTSVIEHVDHDEQFVECIYNLLAPGGIAVITCDFNDQWKVGDLKPEVDARLYTQYDLRERLIKRMPGCNFLDKPDWDCPNPDFLYLGKYRYTFATFVVIKNQVP